MQTICVVDLDVVVFLFYMMAGISKHISLIIHGNTTQHNKTKQNRSSKSWPAATASCGGRGTPTPVPTCLDSYMTKRTPCLRVASTTTGSRCEQGGSAGRCLTAPPPPSLYILVPLHLFACAHLHLRYFPAHPSSIVVRGVANTESGGLKGALFVTHSASSI